jgi:hypothetical protein
MTNLIAWQDRDLILSVLSSMSTHLRSYKFNFDYLAKVKTEILDNPERLAGLKEIIDVDPSWTMKELTDKYLLYKTIYDWLKANGY